MIRLADYVMQRLYEASCEHVFLVTGRGMLFLSDALARHEGLKSIPVHHEQSASYAAMAYSQASQKLGVCMVSTGCASTNAITGVLCAWQDDVPCIFISGQHKLEETVNYTHLPIRTYGQQEADIVSLVSPITKYAVMIKDKTDIAFEIDKAIHLAQSGRKGPVWIDIPLCIQNARIEPSELLRYIPETEKTLFLSEETTNYVVTALNDSQRPVILIGSGIRSAKAVEELTIFLNKFHVPVVYAASATDVVDSEKVLSMGCVGAMGANRSANFTVQNADLVLIIGCRLTSMVRGDDVNKFARDAKIIAVDIDEHEHQKHKNKIDMFIHSDAKVFLNNLLQKEINATQPAWIEKCHHWKQIFPKCENQYLGSEKVDLYYLSEILTKYLPDNAICVTDSGLEELIIPTTVNFKKEQRVIHPVSQGAMGYALPAAIGAYYSTNQPIIAIIGDGSIMMNVQELQTIQYHNLPIKILVINNNGYAVIRKRQQDLFRTRTIGTDKENGVSFANFKKLADCFDISYELISSTKELDKLEGVFASNGSVLCEIMAKEDQEYIHSSYRKNANGKFQQPPIEDQSPFLERDLFLSEMIVAPIDQ